MKPLILNELGTHGSLVSESQDIAKELKRRIDHLKLDCFDMEKGGVDYAAVKESEAFLAYKDVTRALNLLNLDTLITEDAKSAFWINIYNALVVHGVVALNIKRSVKEVSQFFGTVSYGIGGFVFSLDDIEHGILRGNRKQHIFSRPPFRKQDRRLAFVLNPGDPRIHFALVCGSTSCPPIDVYETERIHEQLDTVSDAFVNSEEVTLDRERRQLILSRIFKWYAVDFGGKQGVLSFIAKYRFDEEDKAYLKQHEADLKITYSDYDWSLNAA